MPVPDVQSLMLPRLKALSGGASMPLGDVRERVARSEGITPDDLRGDLLPSGRQPVFTNRVSWAVTHLAIAGLDQRVRRSVYRLTENGERLLAAEPARIDLKSLRDYPSYIQWRTGRRTPSAGDDDATDQPDPILGTPEEELARIHRKLGELLEPEVLNLVRAGSPAFLERVVVDLLIRMGYGGGCLDMGRIWAKLRVAREMVG